MSELSGFVYIKSHVTPHVKSKAQKLNCTAGTPTPRLCSVVQWSGLRVGSESDDPGSSPGRGKAMCP